MRVTQYQIHNLALQAVSDSRSNLQQRQKVAATGQRLEVPQDDPTGASRARLLNGLLSESKSHVENVRFGKLRLKQAEQSLAEAGNVLVRAKELTLAMANDTTSNVQRSLVADEIDQLRQSLIDIANTKQGGEYLFANVNTQTAPIDAAGNFSYDVDLYDQVRSIETGLDTTGEIGSSGSMAFGQRAADPNSVDAFAVLSNLSTALRSGDTSAIRANVDTIDQAHQQIVSERARVGVRENRLNNAAATAQQSVELYKTLESNIVDADAAEAFSALSLAQTTLQAAVSVSSKILGPSLLDRI